MIVREQTPPPHAKYLVERDGCLFTATPCYGMHVPWWVVKTMGLDNCGEVDPVEMRSTDEWFPLVEAIEAFRATDGLTRRRTLDDAIARVWAEFDKHKPAEVEKRAVLTQVAQGLDKLAAKEVP